MIKYPENYTKKYIESINKGLISSQFKINKEVINPEGFFNSLFKQTHKVKRENGRIFFFGNGASAAFSNHMALDWSKNGKVIAHSLSDSAMITALSNDYNYDDSFVEFLKINTPTKYDFVVTTSSSGNSPNIIKVLKFCSENSITTLSMSGLNKDNKSYIISDFSIFVDMKTYGIVECIHQIFHHIWLDSYLQIKEWEKTESQDMNFENFKL